MLSSVVVVLALCALSSADYWQERSKFIQDEENMSIGANLKLSDKEKIVNEILMKYKKEELQQGFENPGEFPPALHFFKAKKLIEKSKVFGLIKKIPKGGALHLHDTALIDPNWVVYNVTYKDHLYLCKKDSWTFAFADPKPQDDCWQSVKDLRTQIGADKFDQILLSKLTLEVPHPESTYKDINQVWKAFMDIFSVITPLITYRPVFEEYLYGVLQSFHDDNIQYIEMRGTLPLVYDLTGWPSNPIQVVGIMESIATQFLEDHPGFGGMKFIYGPPRDVDKDVVDEYLQIFQMMKEMFPDFVAGFDLVGQEDTGKPLKDFVSVLQQYSPDTKFFFHSGETDWNGQSTDLNLIDAILLNTTRIGHGFALTKHPKVLQEVKARGIAVEVNPISNQVLMLVKDLRNHPANQLIAEDYPLVISSDDPAFWGALPLSHDFYMAFMGMANANADLRFLKQLAVNSISYSAMDMAEKKKAMQQFDKNWERFLNEVVGQFVQHPKVLKKVYYY